MSGVDRAGSMSLSKTKPIAMETSGCLKSALLREIVTTLPAFWCDILNISSGNALGVLGPQREQV